MSMRLAASTGVLAATPYFSQFYLDPENQTGQASDSNSGTQPFAPLLTFAAAIAKKPDSPIRIAVRGTILPQLGGFSGTGAGTAVAHNVIRTQYAILEPWTDDRWGFGSNWTLASGKTTPMLANCQFLDMRGVALVGSGFSLAQIDSPFLAPCQHIRYDDWLLTADPTNQADSTKAYGVSGLTANSPVDWVATNIEYVGGDWTIPGAGGGGIHVNGSIDLPITDSLLQAYMHDYTDGDGIDIGYWDNFEVDMEFRNTFRINPALHVDSIQCISVGGGDGLTINVKGSNTFGAHVRSTDLTNNGRIATNIKITADCEAALGGSHDFALAHTPGLLVTDSNIEGILSLELKSGTAIYGGNGADIVNSVLARYSNSSKKQIHSIDAFTRANVGNVQAGTGFLPLP